MFYLLTKEKSLGLIEEKNTEQLNMDQSGGVRINGPCASTFHKLLHQQECRESFNTPQIHTSLDKSFVTLMQKVSEKQIETLAVFGGEPPSNVTNQCCFSVFDRVFPLWVM